MKNHIDSNFAIAIIALVSACVGFAFWFNSEQIDLSSVKYGAESETTVDLDDSHDVAGDSSVKDAPTTVVAGEQVLAKVDQIFVWLPDYQRKLDPTAEVKPSEGAVLISSILSPDESKMVYAEVSNCFEYIENVDWGLGYKTSENHCKDEYNYGVYVSDLETGEITQIYEKSQKPYKQTSFIFDTFISTAHAGGTPTYGEFPIGWSSDGEWFFTRKGVILSAATGGGPDIYTIGRINVGTSEYEELTEGSTIFSSDFRYMIYTRHNPNLPLACGWGSPFNPNYLDLVLYDFETDQEQYLFRSEIDEIAMIESVNSSPQIRLLLNSSKISDEDRSDDQACIESEIHGIDKDQYEQKTIDFPFRMEFLEQESDFEVIERGISTRQ